MYVSHAILLNRADDSEIARTLSELGATVQSIHDFARCLHYVLGQMEVTGSSCNMDAALGNANTVNIVTCWQI